MTNILLLAVSAGLSQAVRSLPGHDVTDVDRETVERHARPDGVQDLVRLDGASLPEIVILGGEIPVGEALSISQMIDSGVPGIELMLEAQPDTDLALRAMRVGVREIVSPAIPQDELKVLLHRASDNISNRLKPHLGAQVETRIEHSRIIAVVSAKGGVGKSTVAANVAVGLAKVAPMETVLVDLDVQFGDAATLLDLNPTHSIADAFGTSAALDTLILKTFLTVHPAGLYVLAGADSPTVSDHVSSSHVKRLLDQLSSQFRYVVVDTGAGLSEHTLAALEGANDVILVSSMDVTSIRSLRKEVDVLSELGLLPKSRRLVLNMEDRRSGLAVRDVEAVIGMSVDVVIPRSAEVPVAGNRGEPIMLATKPGPAAKSIAKLVGGLVEESVDPGHGSKKSRKSKKLGKRMKTGGDKSS